MQIVLQDLWIRHIERFSENMRGRLYAALIAYLKNGTEIPEKLLPQLGIILDLMAEKGIVHGSPEAPAPVDPTEQQYLDEFMAESAPGYSRRYQIEPPELAKIINSIFDYWQEPTPHGGRALRHKNSDDFWSRMSDALHRELTTRGFKYRAGA